MPSEVATGEKICHAERSGEENEVILAAQSKHPYSPTKSSSRPEPMAFARLFPNPEEVVGRSGL